MARHESEVHRKLRRALELTHAVQVRETGGGGGQWWETIAAFNVEAAALAYVGQCRVGKLQHVYRVVKFSEAIS